MSEAPPDSEDETAGPYHESQRAQHARDVLDGLRMILDNDPEGLEAQLEAMASADETSLSIGTGEVFCHLVTLMITRGAPPQIVLQQFQRAMATAMEITQAMDAREEEEPGEGEATH